MNSIVKQIIGIMLIATVFVSAAEIAVVARITGDVNWQESKSAAWGKLKMGTLLPAESVIRTGSDGFATVLYLDDRSSVKVCPKTELVVGGVRNKGIIEKNVKMNFGQASFEVTKGNRQFRVETPTSVASVKGTHFLVHISQVSKMMTLYGIEGIVAVSRLDGAGGVLNVTVRTKASDGSGYLIKDTISDAEFQSIEKLLQGIEQGDTAQILDGHELFISANSGGKVTPKGKRYLFDNVPVTVIATPTSGYFFTGWKTSSEKVELSSLTDPKTNVLLHGDTGSLEARFSKNVCYADVTLKGEGTVSHLGKCIVERNQPVTIRAVSAPNYRFSRWSGSAGVTISDQNSAVADFTFGSDGSVQALFVRDSSNEGGEYQVSFTPTDHASLGKEALFLLNSPGKIRCVPHNGYYFLRWEVVKGSAEFGDASRASTTVTLNSESPVEIRALCVPIKTFEVDVRSGNGYGKKVTVEYIETGL